MISVTRITTRKCDQILLTYHLEHDFAAIRTFVECRPRSFALFDWKQSSAWRSSAYVQCIHHTLSFMNAEVTERLPQTQRRGFAQFGCKQCIQRFLGPSSMLQLCLVPSCILTGHYSLLEIRPALLGTRGGWVGQRRRQKLSRGQCRAWGGGDVDGGAAGGGAAAGDAVGRVRAPRSPPPWHPHAPSM